MSTRTVPTKGPTQGAARGPRTRPMTKAPPKPLRGPLPWSLLVRLSGSLISKSPKRLRAKTAKSTETGMRKAGFWAKAPKAAPLREATTPSTV